MSVCNWGRSWRNENDDYFVPFGGHRDGTALLCHPNHVTSWRQPHRPKGRCREYISTHHTTPHHTTPHHTSPHHTSPHHITPHHTSPHHTTPHLTTPTSSLSKEAALATVLLLLDLVQTLGLAGATIYNILTQGYPQSSELCALPVETGSCCPNRGMQQGEWEGSCPTSRCGQFGVDL